MLDDEPRRREIVRQSEYALTAREASAGTDPGRRARRRVSALLREPASRLAAPPAVTAGPARVPLLDQLSR